MKNYDEIIKKAQESYNRYFKNAPEIPGIESENKDVKLDVEGLEKSIAAKKDQLENHMKNLDAIKAELSKEAVEARDKVIKSKAEDAFTKMYNEYEDERVRLAKLSEELKAKKKAL